MIGSGVGARVRDPPVWTLAYRMGPARDAATTDGVELRASATLKLRTGLSRAERAGRRADTNPRTSALPWACSWRAVRTDAPDTN
jgi:hypothetical protein